MFLDWRFGERGKVPPTRNLPDTYPLSNEAFGLMADVIACDGFQLADERESLLWGFVNMLDAQTQRLDRAADKMMPDLRDLQREQDGTEIKAPELELMTDRARRGRQSNEISRLGNFFRRPAVSSTPISGLAVFDEIQACPNQFRTRPPPSIIPTTRCAELRQALFSWTRVGHSQFWHPRTSP